jgi:hypothetical protein
MEVNSLAPKTLWFQGILTERPLPERQLLPATVGGRGGFELSVPDRIKFAVLWEC